jgi:GNAT superfamily N-acetyltransferase
MGTGPSGIMIRPATAADLPEVRAMLVEYAAWINQDLAFQEFAAELDHLPGDYAPPTGALLVADSHRTSPPTPPALIAVIALRRRNAETCEMKRLYVRPIARGLGLGRALVHRLLDEARSRGYRTIVLDTLPAMHDAQAMYERLGFTDIPAYYDTPIAGTRFMSKEL